ncbi:hypothetical protein GCM10009601_03360 [Streptomyces thermospinosisporus]|uniref:Secreted protein n=1 Tax=Streptomyces thermospinosisporus TaxID=161482 RepID=A0ABP4J6T8_9ACTN
MLLAAVVAVTALSLIVLFATGDDDSPDTEPTSTGTESPGPSLDLPSGFPSGLLPSGFPSELPSELPSGFPSELPSELPSGFPTAWPSGFPSHLPSGLESLLPSLGEAAAR